MNADEVLDRLRREVDAARDPRNAEAMAAYMRDQFPFAGIKTPERRALTRRALAGVVVDDEQELRRLAEACWAQPERELQYVACDVLARHVGVCGPSTVGWSRALITTKSWWDTVDPLATNVVGALVRRHRACVETMDAWIDDDDVWLVRTALLHQLRWKHETDADRLFAYCLRRAADPDFFVRKAIGWALREHSKTDPEAVERFVADHADVLSTLSRREALKVIERRRAGSVVRSRP